jgi:uncharacterized protein YodC (DUF2158 family)
MPDNRFTTRSDDPPDEEEYDSKALGTAELASACDTLFLASEFAENFRVDGSEVDLGFHTCKYFDERGNCVLVNEETKQVTYIAAKKVEDPAHQEHLSGVENWIWRD